MSIELGLLLFGLGFLGAFFSGLLGIGGGLVVVPLLLYLPEALGLAVYDVKGASAIAVAQIAVATGSGTVAYLQRGQVYTRLVLVIVGAMVLGGLLGGWVSRFVPAGWLLVLFASMATLGALSMLVPISGKESAEEQPPFNPLAALACGLTVGTGIGLVGGGGFLLVPLQVFVLGIPTRVAIATGLAATFPTAAAAFAGKLLSGQLQPLPTLLVCLPAIPGARLGAALGSRLAPRVLRLVYALFVLTIAVGLWFDVAHAR